MKKSYLILMAVILLGSTGIVTYKHSKKFQRERYETMLKIKFQNISFKKEKGEEGVKAADQPEMAAIQDYYMTVDPATGTVPVERLSKAYEELSARRSFKSTTAPPVWTGCPVEMGGRTRTIMFDPNDPNHKKVWAGSVTGGLWYNPDITNAASNWVALPDFQNCLAIHCITYDPVNPMIFYLGTGEAETAIITYRESSGLGNGIWKSTNGGQTWSKLNSTTGFPYVTKLVVRNESGNSVIYAGVVSGLYHGVHQSVPSDGLYRSTDGGTTWTQVLPNIAGTSVPYSPADVVMGGDGRIYVGTMPNLESEGGATLLFSDTGLPGSWTVNTTYKSIIESDPDYPIPGRVVLATSSSNPSVVYALIGSGFISLENNFKYYYCFHIIKSSDKGVTWSNKNLPYDLTSGVSFATIAWHALDIAVDPNDENSLYIGGLDVHHSTNGGDSWHRVSDWALMYYGGGPQYIHADQHTLVYKPGSSSELLAGTDGGVFYTGDATSFDPTFEQRNTGYSTLQYYTADIISNTPTISLLGGLQDNGCLFYDGSAPVSISSMLSGGDGAFCFFDKDEPDFCITSLYYNVWYVFTGGSMINYLSNWESGVFVNPADYDYKNNTIYSNACDFIGTNLDYYSRISNVTAGAGGTFKKANTTTNTWFSAVRWSHFSPVGHATIFLGTQSGRLFKLTNAETNPLTTEITGSNFPVGSISCISTGATENELLVTFSNYGVASVWHTVDGGLTWKNKETNLPDMPVRWGIFHPASNKQVMLATETGTWTTDNFDEDNPVWSQAVNGMTTVRTDMLNIRDDDYTVVAATHGRGLFTATWDIYDQVSDLANINFSIFPNPVIDVLNMTWQASKNNNILFKVFDQTGRQITAKEKNSVQGFNEEKISFSGRAAGVYYVALYSNGKLIRTEKVVKD